MILIRVVKGARLRGRPAAAHLRGVTFGADQLNPLILQSWIGYTLAFRSGWRLYVLRSQNSEIQRARRLHRDLGRYFRLLGAVQLKAGVPDAASIRALGRQTVVRTPKKHSAPAAFRASLRDDARQAEHQSYRRFRPILLKDSSVPLFTTFSGVIKPLPEVPAALLAHPERFFESGRSTSFSTE